MDLREGVAADKGVAAAAAFPLLNGVYLAKPVFVDSLKGFKLLH